MADFILGGSKITADGGCSHEIKRHFTPWKESYDQPRQHIKKQRHYFANKCHVSFLGTSMVVQWLRRHVSNAGEAGSIPGRGTKIPHGEWCVQKF